ncbi:MAG: hypothetical protein LUF68_01415 [Clostridiales bacterium]|nr:hypothetical protein [Clostridiales bacterium]
MYTFHLQKNVHMYNHLLTISDGQTRRQAIVESAPTKQQTLLVWLADFGFPPEEEMAVQAALERWLTAQGVCCVFRPGRGR